MIVANLCYEGASHFVRFGSLHHGGARHWAGLSVMRSGITRPGVWWIGNCLVDDPPYIDGDIYTRSKKKVGHIHTRQTADGAATQYYGVFTVRVDGCPWLRIKLEDE